MSKRMPEGSSRRRFCCQAAALTMTPFLPLGLLGSEAADATRELPVGASPLPVELPWFANRLQAFVWRNWSLVPVERMAAVVGTSPRNIERTGRSLGLPPSRPLRPGLIRRANLTLIRRNWHLLPYGQLLALLGWTAEEMAFTLREDDFFFEKLGRLKPKVQELRWQEPGEAELRRAGEIKKIVQEAFKGESLESTDPLFSFVKSLSTPLKEKTHDKVVRWPSSGALRLGYSYFALYGDPLIDPTLDPYPEGYLERLAALGVNAVWLQGVLSRLSPLPWAGDKKTEERRSALRQLVIKAGKHGIRIFVYLNEPRALVANSSEFDKHPQWRGVAEAGFNALCTSNPDVRTGLRDGIADLCRAVPDLGGFFSISASENLTNCWSHGGGNGCPRCKQRRPAEVIAEINATFLEGIQAGGGRQQMVVWDWGWDDSWAAEAIGLLPAGVKLMSVSEWGLPIERGGIKSEVGEYCLSGIGPGPRAQRHWAVAKKRSLQVAAKMQVGTTWEMAAVPYLPAVENVCRHVAKLRELGVKSLMLGWTLGGYPSSNIEAVSEIMDGGSIESLARRRHGNKLAPDVITFWHECSLSFAEFPFHGGTVYLAPLQVGPANPLWLASTGYGASMVGIPYDDLNGWRSIYPAAVFAQQLEKASAGIFAAVHKLRRAVAKPPPLLEEELTFAEVAAIHFSSVANQTRFVVARQAADKAAMKKLATAEMEAARRLHNLQCRDSRIGFEASNQYFYLPLDLVEKVINCRWLLEQLGDG